MSSFEERIRQQMHEAAGGHTGVAQRAAAEDKRLGALSSANPVPALIRYFAMFKQFDGRCGRAEFWWAAILVNGGAAWALEQIDMQTDGGLWLLAFAANVALLLPLMSAAVRRLHDTGKSGGLLLAVLLPTCITQVVVAILLTRSAQYDDNAYGPGTPP